MATISTLTANLELNAAKFRKELDASKKRIRDLEKGTNRGSRQVRKMEGAFRGAASGVATIHGPLGGVASRITAVNSLVSTSTLLWTGLGAAIGGSAFALTKSVSVFSQIEAQQLKTQALIQSTGQAAGRTFGQLDRQARDVARATLASTQQIRQAQGILLTFRTVQEENFDRAIGLSQDLAAVLGTQAKDAALQLGKALEEPIIGLTSLRRAGVSFSETEKELIKDLSETGRLAEAQGMILDKLAVQVGGAGAGAAGGIAGKVDSLSQEWEELMEGLANSGPAGIASSSMNLLASSVRAVRQAIAPQEMERLAELDMQIAKTSRALAGAQAGGNQVLIDQFQANLDLYTSQRDAIMEDLIAEERRQQQARQAAEATRQQAEQDRRAREAREANEAGLASLTALEGQLATATDRINQEHEKRLATIEEMQLAEVEIRRAGFETIHGLRTHLAAESVALRDQELAELREREEQAAQREAERAAAEIERARADAENLVSLNREKFQRIHEEALRAAGQDQALEEMRYQQELQRLEEDMQRLRDRNLATAAIEAEFRQAKERAEFTHQQNLTEIDRRAAEERLDNQLKLFDVASKAAITADKRQLAAGIQIAKMLFDAKKREKLKEAMVTGTQAIQEAWASAPFPANIPAVAITTAETAANVATIQGIAHSGLDFVPNEGTYLLDRGEAVLQPRANEALMDFLDGRGGTTEAPVGGDVNVNFTIQANDARGFSELLQRERANIVNIVNQAMEDRGRRGVA